MGLAIEKKTFFLKLCIRQFQQCPSPPPGANPRALAFFLKIGQIPRGGDEKRWQMPRPRDRRLPTPLQFFLLTSE